MAHEWNTNASKNILSLIKEYTGFQYDTDYGGRLTAGDVEITNKVFPSEDEAINYVINSSYYSGHAYLAAYTTKKLSKGYSSAFLNFCLKYKEYVSFKENLTVAYGRKASKVTCPYCGSSISLKYGNRFKACPVCGSTKIISDSSWKALDTKKRIMEKAAENLSKEADKNDITFVCGMEWHC